jgi:hypothetical protein
MIKKDIERIGVMINGIINALLVAFSFLSLPILFGLFFYYLYQGQLYYCIICLAGIYTFIHLNQSLNK